MKSRQDTGFDSERLDPLVEGLPRLLDLVRLQQVGTRRKIDSMRLVRREAAVARARALRGDQAPEVKALAERLEQERKRVVAMEKEELRTRESIGRLSKGGAKKAEKKTGTERTGRQKNPRRGAQAREEKQHEARRAELEKVRDAKADAVETRKAALERMEAREAELKASQQEASPRVKKVRGQVSRTRTELRKIDAEMDGHESKESAEYDALVRRREARVAKLQALDPELAEAVAQEAGLAKALADLSAERKAAEAALANAQAELAAAEAELAALATGKR